MMSAKNPLQSGNSTGAEPKPTKRLLMVIVPPMEPESKKGGRNAEGKTAHCDGQGS